MKILLHIGWHKTGSTAIQRFLQRNREALLRESGLCYPDAGLIRTAHHLAAWSLQEPLRSVWARKIGFHVPAESLFADILKEARAAGARAVVLSSEEFSLTDAYRLERLQRVLDGHEVSIIAYVRRQDRYVEALYGQMVKAPFVRLSIDIERFAEEQLAKGRLDYGRDFGRWADVFGKDRVSVREYARERFPGGDVRADFCARIGVARTGGLVFAPHADNESMSVESVEFLRRLNRVELSGAEHMRVVEILRERERAAGAAREALLTAGQRARLLERCREGNAVFAREFLDDPESFGAGAAQGGRADATDPDYSQSRFIDTLAFVLPRLLAGEGGTGAPAVEGAKQKEETR